jgi:hypothetical protein
MVSSSVSAALLAARRQELLVLLLAAVGRHPEAPDERGQGKPLAHDGDQHDRERDEHDQVERASQQAALEQLARDPVDQHLTNLDAATRVRPDRGSRRP